MSDFHVLAYLNFTDTHCYAATQNALVTRNVMGYTHRYDTELQAQRA